MASLDPAMAAVMRRMAELRANLPSRYSLPFPESRAQLLFERTPWLQDGPACATRDDVVTADGRTFGRRLVTPPIDDGRHLLVYLHGGGWCVGSSMTHDNIVRRLAGGMRATAWSIDYALAPEAPHSAGLDDCVAAIRLAAREHSDRHLVLAGDSAGAHLALAAALRLRGAGERLIRSLILFYGVYTDACDDESMRAHGDGRHGLSIQAHRRYLDACFGPAGTPQRNAAFVLPARADLRGLPRTWMTAAELDILRDQSRVFAHALRTAGGEVVENEVPGVIHGFLSYGIALPQAGEALATAAAWALRDP